MEYNILVELDSSISRYIGGKQVRNARVVISMRVQVHIAASSCGSNSSIAQHRTAQPGRGEGGGTASTSRIR